MAFDQDSKIYLSLREQIRGYEFASGYHLNIWELADRMAASPTPIRERLERSEWHTRLRDGAMGAAQSNAAYLHSSEG